MALPIRVCVAGQADFFGFEKVLPGFLFYSIYVFSCFFFSFYFPLSFLFFHMIIHEYLLKVLNILNDYEYIFKVLEHFFRIHEYMYIN